MPYNNNKTNFYSLKWILFQSRQHHIADGDENVHAYTLQLNWRIILHGVCEEREKFGENIEIHLLK